MAGIASFEPRLCQSSNQLTNIGNDCTHLMMYVMRIGEQFCGISLVLVAEPALILARQVDPAGKQLCPRSFARATL